MHENGAGVDLASARSLGLAFAGRHTLTQYDIGDD